jgi:hypothetical protein
MKLLSWLMSRFNVSPALIGDIAEDAARHSAFWMLRQSAAAIFSELGSGLGGSKLQTLTAVAFGSILWFVVASVIVRAVTSYVQYLALATMCAFAIGWVVAWAHREQPLGASLLFMTVQFLAMAAGVWRTIELAFLNYPSPYAWALALQIFTCGSFLLATFLGALTASRKRAAV